MFTRGLVWSYRGDRVAVVVIPNRGRGDGARYERRGSYSHGYGGVAAFFWIFHQPNLNAIANFPPGSIVNIPGSATQRGDMQYPATYKENSSVGTITSKVFCTISFWVLSGRYVSPQFYRDPRRCSKAHPARGATCRECTTKEIGKGVPVRVSNTYFWSALNVAVLNLAVRALKRKQNWLQYGWKSRKEAIGKGYEWREGPTAWGMYLHGGAPDVQHRSQVE